MKVWTRALTFKKSFSLPRKENDNWWVVLGHTDEMECSDLREMSLEDIKKYNDELYKNDRDSAYHHIVYLIADCEESIDKDQLVWASQDSYLAVTRIHFSETIDHQNQFNDLVDHFNNFCIQERFKGVVWNTYHTTELSDMVLVSKAESFQKLSQWVFSSTKKNLVGDAYTYFCLPCSFVLENEETTKDPLDTLDFVSIRFSIKDNRANIQIDQIRDCLGEQCTKNPFDISGNEDAIICGEDVPVQNLLKFYRFCYNPQQSITKVFSDIITRVGSKWYDPTQDEQKYPNIEPPKSLLFKYSSDINKKVYDNILKDKNSHVLDNREWLRPLVELTNTLVHMSKSATLDEPVFLILPAISAFWDNVVNALLENSSTVDSNILLDDPMYWRFSELCVHTLEHLMRAEGQLSQRPEVRPLAYDIPVFVLEYATAFLLYFNEMITSGEQSSNISFLLVPSTDELVYVDELFESKGEVPGLLQITVPFTMLYKPDKLLPTLCHELAHYVGERFRLREVRYDYFLKAVALEIQKFYFEKVEDTSNCFQKFLIEKFLQEPLESSLRSNSNESQRSTIAKEPLVIIVSKILKLAEKGLSNYELYVTLIKEYLSHKEYSGAKIYPITKHELEDRYDHFKLRIEDLRVLFRETYADVCMLHFLKLSPEMYFDVSIRNWKAINDGILVQVCIPLLVSNYSLTDIKNEIHQWGAMQGAPNNELHTVCKKIEGIFELLQRHEHSSEKYLYKYIRLCKDELNSSFSFLEGSNKNDLDEMYKLIIEDSSDYKEILSVIDYSRKYILNFLKK